MNSWSSQTRYLHYRLLRAKNSTTKLFPIFYICVTTCLGTRTLFFAGYSVILEYRAMNGLMFWPRLPWIRQNSTTSLSTLMTVSKVNGTTMSPANCRGTPIIMRSFTPMERRRDDLCRARIRHAYFTNGYLLRGELRPLCCKTRHTVRHVLLSCAKYAHIRRKYWHVVQFSI